MSAINYFSKALAEAQHALRPHPVGTFVDVGSPTYPLVFEKTKAGVLVVGPTRQVLLGVKAKRLRTERNWNEPPGVARIIAPRPLTWGEAMYKNLHRNPVNPAYKMRTTDKAIYRECSKFEDINERS